MSKDKYELASQHVNWWIESVRPLLIANFVHGYKHGQDAAFAEVNELERTERERWLTERRLKGARRERR